MDSKNARLLSATPAELARLRLTPEEGFILSRIDRSCTVAEILAISGLPEARTLSVLKNLRAKGAIRFEGEPAPAPAAPRSPLESKYGSFIFSPADLGEEVDLSLEAKKEVLFLHAQLEQKNHYELLGVRPVADKQEIKRAYFELSKKFHPDRYFGKKLGSFQARLAEIFQRLTRAYEVLSDDERRAEYDRTAKILFHEDDLAELERRQLAMKEEARRAEERRRRLLQGKGFGKLTRARDLVQRAQEALAAGRFDVAQNMLQDALALDPRNEAAREKLASARKLADELRAKNDLAAARRCEEAGDYTGALERFKAAAALSPDNASAHEGWARALLQTGGDLKEAKHHAERAVMLDPTAPSHHITLGLCYHRLGLKKNARREFEKALELDPKQELARAQLKKL